MQGRRPRSFLVRLCQGIMKWPGRIPPSDELCGLAPAVDQFLLVIWFVIAFYFLFLFQTRKSSAVSLLSSKIIAFCEKADGERY